MFTAIDRKPGILIGRDRRCKGICGCTDLDPESYMHREKETLPAWYESRAVFKFLAGYPVFFTEFDRRCMMPLDGRNFLANFSGLSIPGHYLDPDTRKMAKSASINHS